LSALTQFFGERRLAQTRPPVPPVARVAISARPVFGPWGGGNQWLLQMVRYLNYAGYEVRYDLREEVDCILILPSRGRGRMTFGLDELRAYRRRFPRARVIHRVNDNDVRKGTTEMDPFLASFDEVTDHTVFISEWLRDHHAAKWFDRARPHSCILNGADPAVFHPIGNRVADGDSLRFVTHHWSDNPMKGFPRYAELDARIAAGELPGIELWVIGRWPRDLVWKSARTFPAAHGPELAALLRQCHLYVTASLHEPGGMHFIEGLQCGLPLLYHLDGGGIVELGQRFGVGFRDDLASGVREICARYRDLRSKVLAAPPSGDGMCIAYREVIQRVLAEV
jgi:glycosyltransferase involved in cell wall biosynthesis